MNIYGHSWLLIGAPFSFVKGQVFRFENYDRKNTPNCDEETHIVNNSFVSKVSGESYVNSCVKNGTN